MKIVYIIPLFFLLLFLSGCDFFITGIEDRINPLDSENPVVLFQAGAVDGNRVRIEWKFRSDVLPTYKVTVKASEIPRYPDDGFQMTDTVLLQGGAAGLEGTIPDTDNLAIYYCSLFVKAAGESNWTGPYTDSFDFTVHDISVPVKTFVQIAEGFDPVLTPVDGAPFSSNIDSARHLGLILDSSLLENKNLINFDFTAEFSGWSDIALLNSIALYGLTGNSSDYSWTAVNNSLTETYVTGVRGSGDSFRVFSLADFFNQNSGIHTIVLKSDLPVTYEYGSVSTNIYIQGTYYEK